MDAAVWTEIVSMPYGNKYAHDVQTERTFTVYVTVTDSKNPPEANEVVKIETEKLKLLISQCAVEPEMLSGNETFTVSVTIENTLKTMGISAPVA